jgi:hypothetical protein
MGTAWSTIILQWPLHNYFLQLGQVVWASIQSVLSFLDVYGYSMEHHYFAVAIAQLFPAACLGRWYRPVFSQSYLRCLWVQHGAPLFCSGHFNYFLQLGQAVWASFVLSFLDAYGYSMEHHYFAVAIVQLFPAAWVDGTIMSF